MASVLPQDEVQGLARASFERILIPLDGSDMAAGILPVAEDLAIRLGARIDLLAIVDPETIELPAYMPTVDMSSNSKETADEVELERVKAATQYLNSVAESMRGKDIKVSVEAVVGDAAREIVAAAGRKHSDVIAMATRGRSAIGRGLLGSVTDKVAHSSPAPMLIVRPGSEFEANPISRIIIGLDGSPVAESALDAARYLAVSLDVELVLIRATAMAARLAAYGGEPYFSGADIYGDTESDATEYLQGIAEKLEEQGAKTAIRVGPGAAVNEIEAAASDQPGSLIILATRGRSGLSRWVLGSVTDRVIRSSDDPVLVIPPTVGGWS